MSDGEALKKNIYNAHLVQGFPEPLAKEVSDLTLAISAAVCSVFVDIAEHSSCDKVTVAATLCGAQIVINKLQAIIGVTDIMGKDAFNMEESIH